MNRLKLILRSSVPGMLLLACIGISAARPGKSGPPAYKHGRHTVAIENMKFNPSQIRVHAGDTITWINRDMIAHNVTETSSAWASPPIQAGKSWQTVAAKSAGYYCTIHPTMKGKITVTE